MVQRVVELEEVRPKIEEIRKKVSQNQGGLVLCLRKIYAGNDDIRGSSPPNQVYVYHLETGLISGELEEKEDLTQVGEIPAKNIYDWSAHLPRSYIYVPDFFIPVEKKLVRNMHDFVRLYFTPEEFKQAKDGKIAFSRIEFLKVLEGYPPYLEGFDLIMGEEEVRKYITQKKEVICRNIDGFFRLMTG